MYIHRIILPQRLTIRIVCNLYAIHGKRITIQKKDMDLVKLSGRSFAGIGNFFD